MNIILNVRKFGNSLAVTIPATICKMQDIDENTKFELLILNTGIQLKRVE